MKRRLAALFLALAMLTGLLPLQVLAEEMSPSAQSILLSQSTAQLQVGQQLTLTAAVTPESVAASAVWSSQNEAVAVVENGTITAIAPGSTTISLECGVRKALCSVTVVSGAAAASLEEEITVYFSLLGDEKHGSDGQVHTLADGNLSVWIEQTAYTVSTNASVKDVFLEATVGKYSCEFNVDGDYISSVNGLGEFSNGARSGWKYLLNGSYPNKSIAAQKLKDGDVILFHYTDDYTKDNVGISDIEALEAVIGLIQSIGDVTLEKEKTIRSAREAYDALTDAQKQAITNYATLTDAEKALAKLASPEDTAAAAHVDRLIAAIGEVTWAEDHLAIPQARKAYDALTFLQKLLVENRMELVAAEAALEHLENTPDPERIYYQTGDYLERLGTPSVGTSRGEWAVIGLKRSGREVSTDYFTSAYQHVAANIDSNQRLHLTNSTENSRLILGLTAMGYDVRSIAGYDLLAGLNSMDYIREQGINGTVWALIAFTSHNYAYPSGDVSRKALIQEILSAQHDDGGWSLTGSDSDPDITGMALTALAPFYSSDTEVKAAVDQAISYLSGTQNAIDGGYPSCESAAQVVVALTALDIDPHTDNRFVKNGISVLDALCSFAREGGGFSHTDDGERNTMATEQGYYALTAYFRMLDEKKPLFDMTDIPIQSTPDYIITAGNGKWVSGDGDRTLTSNGSFGEFVGVKQDGIMLDRSLYTADAGMTSDTATTVTLRGTYLETLNSGGYTVALAYSRCEASATLTVVDAEDSKEQILNVEALIRAIGIVTKNSKEKISAARAAYDALTESQKKQVSNYNVLVQAEKAYADIADKITVYFTLMGDSAHGDNGQVHTLAGGGLSTWISRTAVTVTAPATVFNVFHAAVAGRFSYTNKGNYISSINSLAEFTNGPRSGWKYQLNGNYPSLGVEQQTVKDGDVILFHYTDDYVAEENGGVVTSGAQKVIQLINAIGTVTLKKEAAIKAAREAYDQLSDAEKAKVTNYDKLQEAEYTLAALRATDEDKKAAKKVADLIKALGTITEKSRAGVEAARKAYDALTDLQKLLVTNYKELEAAEAALAALKRAPWRDIYEATGNYLESLGTPAVGAVGGEWAVLGLARSGRDIPEGYYNSVLSFVEQNIDENERLHRAKSTENARLILALTAIDKDVTDVGGHNLLMSLTDMEYIQYQGINGPIWALIAFDSGNYSIPEGDVTREGLIDTILAAQLEDGGWSLSGSHSDPDMTGMAVQALAPYYDQNHQVQMAVDAAVKVMSEMQNGNGAYSGADGASSEALSQIIVALTAIGIDPDTDARFTKNGISVLDALLAYYVEGSGFRHILDGNSDGMATEQAYYALTAYYRMLTGMTSLYDMTDIIDMGGITEEPDETTVSVETVAADEGSRVWPWIFISVVCTAGISIVVINRKKLFGRKW